MNLRRRGVAAAAVVALVGIGAPASAGATTITMSGSTSIAPLASKLASKYVKSHNVTFKILQGGSDIGVADVANARVDLGMSSRDPKPTDPGGIVFNKIARDAICVITNKSNQIPNLSNTQVKAIFGGDVRDWSDVQGSPRSDTIDVYVRTAASGTQDAFQKIFMGSTAIFNGAAQKSSNGLVRQSVASTQNPNGIGYVSQSFTDGVWAVPYEGVACTLANAKSGQYTGVRNFWLVSRGELSGASKKWVNWIRNSSAAQKIIASQWVPL